MKHNATLRKSIGGYYTYIDYANGESAVVDDSIGYGVGKTFIWSQPKHSTAIAKWEYRTHEQTLTVTYKNSDTRYTYEGVPISVMFDLLMANSLGGFIARVVKPNYGLVSA